MNNFMPELIGAKSDIGPVRSANEDAYWVSHTETPTELGALYLVADGVGGQEAGDVAANAATKIISAEFYKHRQAGQEIPTALEQAIHTANREIFSQAQQMGGGKMGCTLVAAVLHDGRLHVAHVGDARAYYLTGERLLRLTRDDTWVQKQVEANVLTQEQAAKHELRNVVTQVLGNKEQIEVHLARPMEVYTDDLFLLCSDGLHDPLNFQEIRQLLTGKSSQAAADDLVQAAIDAETYDNVTAVVVNVGQIPGRAQPIVSPRGASRRDIKSIPTWVFATFIAALIFFIVGFVLFILPALESNNLGLGGNDSTGSPTGVTPVDTIPVGTVGPGVEIAPTEGPAGVTGPTSTIAPTQTIEPSPTPTETPTNTPEPVEVRACIVGQTFIWQEAQLDSEVCPRVFAQSSLSNRTEVIVLDDTGRPALGPDNSCLANTFWEIQTIDETPTTGWVLVNNLDVIEPGGSCTP